MQLGLKQLHTRLIKCEHMQLVTIWGKCVKIKKTVLSNEDIREMVYKFSVGISQWHSRETLL
jgi:hypothetical protein